MIDICAYNESIFSTPITKTTRHEFTVSGDSIFEIHRVISKVSCIRKSNYKSILTLKIVERIMCEIILTLDHLKELNKYSISEY